MNVSQNFKTLIKKIKQQDLKLTIKDGELTVGEIHLMPVKIFNAMSIKFLKKRKQVITKELKYRFEGALFRTIMKEIVVTTKNAESLKGKNISFKYGLYINNKYEYLDLGDFFVKDIPKENKGSEEIEVTAYDKLVYFMKTFKQSDLQLSYPCTVLTLVQKICEVCGVELYSTDFFNADLIVDEDYFTSQEVTYRDVLDKVAQTTFSIIYIKDNKLFLSPISTTPVETLDRSYLSKLVITDKFGPVNALVLGRGDVEDNVEAKDDTSIAQNGRCELRFDENEFVEFKREQVINSMFEQIKGLTYYAFEATDVGVIWLEPGQCIALKDNDTDSYNSYYLTANITINTGIKSSTEAEIPSETETEYKVTTEEEKKTLKVERLAKKNEGLIQDLIQETTEQSQKLSQVEQTVDGITQTVSSIETQVETVEEKVDNAQDTADTANTNAQQAQTTANNAQTTAQNAQTTANTANANAQNAQQTADGAVSQITTTNQKVSQIEQTVEGITQSVSAVEEQIKTVETKADNAQSTANTAQTTADEAKGDAESAVTTANTANTTANEAKNTAETTNNNLTTNYYTKTETNSQIDQKANEITSTVNQTYSTKEETTQAKQDAINSANESTDEKLEDYSTTEEMNSAITQKADSITSEVSKTYSTKTETSNAKNEAINSANASTDEKLEDYTQTSEFGTLIEQNWEHVKIAWNQISQYIQLEGDNGNATMAFYDNNTKFAEMGVNTVDNDRYISFAIPCDYGHDIADGMAWGIQTTSDNKFWPILYIKNFHMANKNAGDFSGELVLEACNLALEGINSSITCGNVKMTTAGVFGGIAYLDQETGSNLLSITPQTVLDDAKINILSNISFYRNSAGSNSFRIGNTSKYCMMTDEGSLSSYDLFVWEDATVLGEFINTSLKEMKKNIKELENGLTEVLSTKIYSYNLKDESDDDKKHIGFIIGDDYSYSEKITSKKNDGANLYSMISVAFKAIQEQQEQIEKILKELEVKNNE